MRRVAIICQNTTYARHALSRLGALWPRGFDPRLVLEGPTRPGGQPPAVPLSLRVGHVLGLAPASDHKNSPYLWARRFGARHDRIAYLQGLRMAKWLTRERIDVLVCLGFASLFGAEILEEVPWAINAHPSLLPRWRGPSPLFWWLRNDPNLSGVTVHNITARADRGSIWQQKIVNTSPTTSGSALVASFGQTAGELASSTLDCMVHGRKEPQLQPPHGSWARRPVAEDAFVQPHLWRAEHLLRFVSGAPFWIAPRISVGGALFFARRGIEHRLDEKLPGDFVQVGARLEVAARDGVVAMEVQTSA